MLTNCIQNLNLHNYVTHTVLSKVNDVLQIDIVIVTNNKILNSVPKSLTSLQEMVITSHNIILYLCN